MPLTRDEIVATTSDVIHRQPHPLELVGVMASEGGSGRVELMVTIRGCHEKPCRLLLNLSRASKAELESELRDTLTQLLHSHEPL